MDCLTKSKHQMVNLVIIVSFLNGCSSFEKKVNVTIDQDYTVIQSDDSRKENKKEVSFELAKQSALVESKGFNSVLVVPVQSENGEVKIKLKPATEWLGEPFYKVSNESVSEIISALIKSQQLLANKKTEEALSVLEKVQEKYSYITYLHFLRASLLTVMNRKQDAQIALEKALKDFPENAEGLTLYESLTGKKFSNVTKEVQK